MQNCTKPGTTEMASALWRPARARLLSVFHRGLQHRRLISLRPRYIRFGSFHECTATEAPQGRLTCRLHTDSRVRRTRGGRAQMRLELCRSHLEILPEGEADLAYIEDTLGLRQAGNQIPLIRLDYARGRPTLIRLAAGNNLRAPQPRRRRDEE